MKKGFYLLSVFFLFFFLSGNAMASIVTITATGTTDTISQTPALNDLLNKELTITAVFNTNATDTNPSLNTGSYVDSLISFSAALDGQPISGGNWDAGALSVSNDSGSPFYDSFDLSTYYETITPVSFSGLGPYSTSNIVIVLRDSGSTAFNSTVIPESYDLADFDISFLSVIFQPSTNGINTRVDAAITSLNVTVDPVPIPGAVWLVGSGLIGFAGIRKKIYKI